MNDLKENGPIVGHPGEQAPVREVDRPISGSEVLESIQIASVIAVIGHLLVAIPMTSMGIVTQNGSVKVWFLVVIASLLAILVGVLAKETDRLYGRPLKGGIWWDYRTSTHRIALVATIQIMLSLAIVEIAVIAVGIGS